MVKTIAVTGGAGFIGRESVERFLSAGYEVVCFDLAEQIIRHRSYLKGLEQTGRLKIVPGSVLDRTAVRDAVSGADVVVHLAAMLGVRKTEENKLACIEININGTDNLLNAAVSHGVGKFVFASSSEVYGEPTRNPVSESDETKGKTAYAVTKLAGEELTKGYHQRYPAMAYSIVRFFNTYGEGQVAQFVISRFVRSVLEGKNPIVYGTGTQTRSYGHVDDVTLGLQLVVEKPVANGKVYNLGNSTQVMTLTQLAQRVIDIIRPGEGLEVEILGDFELADRLPEREIHIRYCDTSLAQRELGYAPVVSIDEGIRRIAEAPTIHADWPEI